MLRIDLCLTLALAWPSSSHACPHFVDCSTAYVVVSAKIAGTYTGDSFNPVDGIHPMDAGKVGAGPHMEGSMELWNGERRYRDWDWMTQQNINWCEPNLGMYIYVCFLHIFIISKATATVSINTEP
jgi:hypothetical protein